MQDFDAGSAWTHFDSLTDIRQLHQAADFLDLCQVHPMSTAPARMLVVLPMGGDQNNLFINESSHGKGGVRH